MIAPAASDGSRPDADEAEETGQLRRCVASGERRAPAAMLRFVLDPAGALTADLKGILPGRGVWVSSNAQALAKAIAAGFSKGFRQNIKAPAGFAGSVEQALAKRLCDILGLAKRAGLVTLGFTKIMELFESGAKAVSILSLANDGGPADRHKMLERAMRLAEAPRVFGLLSGEEMSLAFGRENVVHAAVGQGGLAERIEIEALRLSGFRPILPPQWDLPAVRQEALAARWALLAKPSE